LENKRSLSFEKNNAISCVRGFSDGRVFEEVEKGREEESRVFGWEGLRGSGERKRGRKFFL
jgi:hypothetical protein